MVKLRLTSFRSVCWHITLRYDRPLWYRLREESERVAANTRLPDTEKERILKQKYSAIMAPVVRALEQQVCAS